ncbi:MAG: hypothetical protein PCFJNLEI_00684 [Verrucomicrobiae bacterium]|nr:hypothetical protein [Verrucomicrobiae bacterium]
MNIFYQSTVRGQANPDREKEVVYYGKAFRILLAQAVRMDNTNNLLSEARMLEEVLKTRPDCEPVPGGPIERYEVFDSNTGDMWIMWRVPFQKKEPTTEPGQTTGERDLLAMLANVRKCVGQLEPKPQSPEEAA